MWIFSSWFGLHYMGPWKEVCSCTSSGSLCLRGTFPVHQSGLCLPSPVPWSLATGLAEVPLIALLQSFSCVLHSEKGRARLVSNLSLSNAHGSWGVPAAVYFILAWLTGMCLQGHREVPWQALEVEIQAPVVLQLQKQRPPWGLALFQVSRGLRWMLEAVQFGWG